MTAAARGAAVSLSRGHSRERAADDVADKTSQSFGVTILCLWFRALANNRHE